MNTLLNVGSTLNNTEIRKEFHMPKIAFRGCFCSGES